MRGWITLIAGGVLAALIAFGVAKNGQVVDVNLPFLQPWPMELWRALLIAVLLGAALATLFLSLPLARAKLATRRQTKRIAQLEQEIHGLRTLPIANESPNPATTQRV
jgi:uncharacterized integral membrane protein